MRKRRGYRRSADGGSSWISYSDMMASLLLVFVLVIIYSMYQYFSTLETKTAELDAQALLLGQKESELQVALLSLDDKETELNALALKLDEQEEQLNATQIIIVQRESDLAEAQTTLAAQQEELEKSRILLLNQQNLLDSQQRQIDQLIGVRTQIIRDLQQTLSAASLNATVDEQTGDIMLESTVFFEVNSSTIKESGQNLLRTFVPLYLNVLLSPEYTDYLGEIVIEGHTDSTGTYIANLRLSQQRALAVVQFCLVDLANDGLLNAKQIELLQSILTAKGRSYADPILDEFGNEDPEASRRVEFKFRLKDAEMIQQMGQILSQE